MLSNFFPSSKNSLRLEYKLACNRNNLSFIWLLSWIQVMVFGLHLIHHFRLGMEIFSLSMLPYTVLYSFNILYSSLNLIILPKFRKAPALSQVAVLMEFSFLVYITIIAIMLGVVTYSQGQGLAPYIGGMMAISIVLQGRFKELVVILLCSWILLTIGLIKVIEVNTSSPAIITAFSTIIVSMMVGRMLEKTRLEQFETIQDLTAKNTELNEQLAREKESNL
jgi:hypothetical protein